MYQDEMWDKANRIVFTSFRDEPPMSTNLPSSVVQLEFQQETAPTTGRKHWQGYVITSKRERPSFFKKLIGDGCHLERMRGNITDNEFYCSKSESAIEGTHFKLNRDKKEGDRKYRKCWVYHKLESYKNTEQICKNCIEIARLGYLKVYYYGIFNKNFNGDELIKYKRELENKHPCTNGYIDKEEYKQLNKLNTERLEEDIRDWRDDEIDIMNRNIEEIMKINPNYCIAPKESWDD